VRPVKAPITLAALFRAGSSCCAAGQIIHLDEKAATGCVELHHGGRAGTALDPHRARRSQQSRRQGPAAALGSLFGVLKWQARQLAGLDAVERVTVYDAVVFAPPGGDVKDRPATLPAALFDAAVPAETSSPEAAREVRAAPAWQALAAALTEKARRVHQVAARNVRRSAMWTRPV